MPIQTTELKRDQAILSPDHIDEITDSIAEMMGWGASIAGPELRKLHAHAAALRQSDPYLSRLIAARSELNVAIVQSLPSDDQIIIDHIREASKILTGLIEEARR